MIRYPPLPTDTARATEAAFGNQHPYLKIGKQVEDLLSNLNFALLASADQNLAKSFWPFSLAIILQYWEELTDFQMANATRMRLDLKYALHLPMNFPGFEPSALCKFRQRLFLSQPGKDVFQKMVNRLTEFMTNQENHSTDVEVILSNVCTLQQWEIVMETMSNAIEALAASNPELLRSAALPHWYKRYGKRLPAFNGQDNSKNIKSMILYVGQDGQYLLNAVEKSGLNPVMQMREIQEIAQVWQALFKKEKDSLEMNPVSCSLCPGRLEMMHVKNSIYSEEVHPKSSSTNNNNLCR